MAYGVKYRIEYKDNRGVDTKIDIEKLDYADAVTDCKAGDVPFVIELPDTPVFDPVMATGATVKMLSTTNMMFLGLYSINPKMHRVKAFKGISAVPFWQGFINTEVYNESYALLKDYQVSIACNDGFAILERYKYLDGVDKFTGFATKWSVLLAVLNKMDLPFQNLYFACDHVPHEVTIAANETLFHQLLVDQANYYNEQDKPMTYLNLLKGLLAPYPLQVRWHDGSIYIYDPSQPADASFSAKQFDSSGAYVSTVTLTQNLDISADECRWDADDQAMDIVSGFCEKAIRFSPYAYESPAKPIDMQDQALMIGAPVWTQTTDAETGHYEYHMSGITGMEGFVLGLNATIGGVKKEVLDEGEVYITAPYGNPSGSLFRNETDDIWLTPVSPNKTIIFKASVFVRTKAYELEATEGSPIVRYLALEVRAEIGGKSPEFDVGSGTLVWVSGSQQRREILVQNKGEDIADKWINIEYLVPWNFDPGELMFYVYDSFHAYDTKANRVAGIPLTTEVIEVKIKDVSFSFADVTYRAAEGAFGIPIPWIVKITDSEFEDKTFHGRINDEFALEGDEITLIHSDGVNLSDRGALRKLDKSYTTFWRKPGDAVGVLLPEILLRTLISQYRDSLTKLSGALAADNLMTGAGCLSFFGTIQDTDYLGTRKLMCIGGVYDDFAQQLKGNFLEIKEDDLSIVING